MGGGHIESKWLENMKILYNHIRKTMEYMHKKGESECALKMMKRPYKIISPQNYS